MTIKNRRLRELRKEIKLYNSLIKNSEKEYDKRIYNGKLECLKREEIKILKRLNQKENK